MCRSHPHAMASHLAPVDGLRVSATASLVAFHATLIASGALPAQGEAWTASCGGAVVAAGALHAQLLHTRGDRSETSFRAAYRPASPVHSQPRPAGVGCPPPE